MIKDFSKNLHKNNLHFQLKIKFDLACNDYERVRKLVPLAIEMVEAARQNMLFMTGEKLASLPGLLGQTEF
jgi:hypothetical protein